MWPAAEPLPRLRAGRFGADAATAFAVTGTALLYVYRMPIGGVNLSVFRLVLLAWFAVVLAGLLAGRLRWPRPVLPLLALLTVLIALNLFDFVRTDARRVIGRDIANHAANLALLAAVVSVVRDRAAIRRWLLAFAWTSVVPLAVTVATLVSGSLPLESWLLANQSESAGVALEQYTIEYGSALRAAATFYDPNFYGIYLVQVLAVSLWARARTRAPLALDLLIAANAAALVLTLSRTAWVGAVVLGALAVATMPRRYRVVAFAVVAAASAAVLAAVLVGQGEDPISRSVAARFSDAASTVDRFDYIRQGWHAFVAGPWLGSGSEGLVSDRIVIASAHNVYLSWLAKYGVLGTLPYAVLLFGPLALAQVGRGAPDLRALTVQVLVPLAVMYLAYDAFAFLEFQYLLFGLLWAAALHPIAAEAPPCAASSA